MVVPEVIYFANQINICWKKKRRNLLFRERTPQEKIARLEKAKRSRACFVMHAMFLCRGNYMIPYVFTSVEACEKSSRWLWKESCVSTGVRKPGNTCTSPTAMI